jgi:hypothetical protein
MADELLSEVPTFVESDVAAQIDAIRISIHTALILLDIEDAPVDEKRAFLIQVLAQAQQAISVARFTAFPVNEATPLRCTSSRLTKRAARASIIP